MRLARFMALAGVASRRKSEELIRKGQVQVDGQVVTSPATDVDPRRQEVRVRGQLIRPRSSRVYLALHKPRGYLSTTSDPQGRPTVLDLVEKPQRLFIVGRLDRDSEGLVLLTDDGKWAQDLLHPSRGHLRTYRVLARGHLREEHLDRLVRGVDLSDGPARAARVKVVRAPDPHSTWLEIRLEEGRNRQVRRMLAALGLEVARLIRTQMGQIHLGKLGRGRWRPLTPEEVDSVKGGK